MNKTPITLNGEKLLKEELNRLVTIERPKIISAIQEARSHGDLSENAEYDAAKEKQAFIEGRILECESKLLNAQIIDPAKIDADGKCVFGSTVILYDLDNNQKISYQIVGEDEADFKNKTISVASPLARALIGKESGEIIEFDTPSGIKEYEILDINYT